MTRPHATPDRRTALKNLALAGLGLGGLGTTARAATTREERPTKVDLSKWQSSDKNQSNRGTCIAHSTAAALEANGISVLRAADAAEAKRIVLGLIPDGSQVHHGASQILRARGQW